MKFHIIIVKTKHSILITFKLYFLLYGIFFNTQSQIRGPFWNAISMQVNLLHITSVLLYLADDLLLTFICKFLGSFIDSAWNGNSDALKWSW